METRKLVEIADRAKALTERLYVQMGVGAYHPSVCRNCRGSRAIQRGGKWQIVYGWPSLAWAFENGFEDYKTLHSRIWGHQDLIGYRGVWALVLHEFAHVIQESRSYGSCHNETFERALRELQVLMPFKDTGWPTIAVKKETKIGRIIRITRNVQFASQAPLPLSESQQRVKEIMEKYNMTYHL